MIKVCDAIMGSGKSQAAISYMNEHPEKKFIYITPFVDEAERIYTSCQSLHFVLPGCEKRFKAAKVKHIAELIEQGRNIASTHQAFKYYTPEMLETIRLQGYTLIIDENFEWLEKTTINRTDLDIMVKAGLAVKNENVYSSTGVEYDGEAFKSIYTMLKTRSINAPPEASGNITSYYWTMAYDFLGVFEDVFILTYIFESFGMSQYLELNEIEHQNIGISRTPDGGYRFCDHIDYIPEYVTRLKDMIHILDNDRMNYRYGADRENKNMMSNAWFDKNDCVDQLRKNTYNYFANIRPDGGKASRMWTTFKKHKDKVAGKGYERCFVPCTSRATNKYRDRYNLAYCANIFLDVGEKQFLKKNGIEISDNAYALATMLQWIWRSAIRDGKEIWIYVPSFRMRTLLENWIESTSKGERFIG